MLFDLLTIKSSLLYLINSQRTLIKTVICGDLGIIHLCSKNVILVDQPTF